MDVLLNKHSNPSTLAGPCVEIFKTNVRGAKQASKIIGKLKHLYPTYHFNFDLEDCDKILRVEFNSDSVSVQEIIPLVQEENVDIIVLE